MADRLTLYIKMFWNSSYFLGRLGLAPKVYPCIEFLKFPEGQTGQRGKAEITSLDISRFHPH